MPPLGSVPEDQRGGFVMSHPSRHGQHLARCRQSLRAPCRIGGVREHTSSLLLHSQPGRSWDCDVSGVIITHPEKFLLRLQIASLLLCTSIQHPAATNAIRAAEMRLVDDDQALTTNAAPAGSGVRALRQGQGPQVRRICRFMSLYSR